MTNREFFEVIVNTNINEEITAYASQQIQKLDERNEKRRTTLSKTQQENLKIGEQIIEQMETDTIYTASQIGQTQNITPQKTTAIMKQLAKNGRVEIVEVKNGNRLINGYKIKE